jgi:cell pole-organizing protein PopZ
MTQPAKVQEPSMEEILASIRRIIADDEAKPDDAVITSSPTTGFGLNPTWSKERASDAAVVDFKPDDARRNVQPAIQPVPTAEMQPPTAPDLSKEADLVSPATELETPAKAESEILELTDDMALSPPAPAATFRRVEPRQEVEFGDRSAGIRDNASRTPPPAPDSPDILSQATVSAVETAFNSLAATVLSNNARTLEDLVKEMLRPMLKNWLDDNLPGLVERIVRAEIERVSRGR